MQTTIPLLQNVKVAASCNASWDGMDAIDGDRVHYCAGCKKNVYNLSAMSQAQAEGLLRKHEGHLCVRYYRRTDGTILTQNCPVGLAAIRCNLVSRSKAAAALTLLLGGLAYKGSMNHRNVIMGGPRPAQVQGVKLDTTPTHEGMTTPQPEESHFMGMTMIDPPKHGFVLYEPSQSQISEVPNSLADAKLINDEFPSLKGTNAVTENDDPSIRPFDFSEADWRRVQQSLGTEH